MGRFVSLHSAELRCFAVCMCLLMSYFPLAAMLKSVELMLQYVWLFPFLEGLVKSHVFLHSSLNVWFLLFQSELDVEAYVAIFNYFSCWLLRKFHSIAHMGCVFTAMAAPAMPNAFLSNVLIGLNNPMFLFLSKHKIQLWKQSFISGPYDLYIIIFMKDSDWFKKSNLLLFLQWQISLYDFCVMTSSANLHFQFYFFNILFVQRFFFFFHTLQKSYFLA